VGVASIMRVVVEERTREIGVKLAVGARRRTILWQFFSESLVIMLLGGLIGFGLSAGALQAIKAVPAGSFAEFVGVPVLNPLVIISTVLCLLAIGIVAGMIPAQAAASTDPIAALRK
jgi:putative ABC transport system permease protein